MEVLHFLGYVLLAIGCSALGNRLDALITQLAQRRKKEKSPTLPK